jgi:hypothetical protein
MMTWTHDCRHAEASRRRLERQRAEHAPRTTDDADDLIDVKPRTTDDADNVVDVKSRHHRRRRRLGRRQAAATADDADNVVDIKPLLDEEVAW